MDSACTATPLLTRSPLVGLRAETLPPLAGTAGEVSYWYKGRIAIWQGIRALGLKAGDRVLVPRYHCGSEIAPLERLGLDLAFYRIRPDLGPEIGHVRALLNDSARAIWVTHFFGFPQPLDEWVEIARSRGLLLIEDCCHSLFSRDPRGILLGSSGDMSVFSFAKTLPVPSGGALYLRNPHHAAQVVAGQRPQLMPFLGWARSALEREITSRSEPAGRWIRRWATEPLARRFRESTPPASGPDESSSSMEIPSGWGDWSISSAARYLASRADAARIVECRRRNYRLLEEGVRQLTGLRPLMQGLGHGCAPLNFPLWADDAEALQDHLRSRGIGSQRWWAWAPHPAVERDENAVDDKLRAHVLALPIHQGLNETAVEHMVATLSRWSA